MPVHSRFAGIVTSPDAIKSRFDINRDHLECYRTYCERSVYLGVPDVYVRQTGNCLDDRLRLQRCYIAHPFWKTTSDPNLLGLTLS